RARACRAQAERLRVAVAARMRRAPAERLVEAVEQLAHFTSASTTFLFTCAGVVAPLPFSPAPLPPGFTASTRLQKFGCRAGSGYFTYARGFRGGGFDAVGAAMAAIRATRARASATADRVTSGR